MSERKAYITTAHWVITVGGGYGTFVFEGNEQEAEEMRRHKANWEQAIARKRPATQQEISEHSKAKGGER